PLIEFVLPTRARIEPALDQEAERDHYAEDHRASGECKGGCHSEAPAGYALGDEDGQVLARGRRSHTEQEPSRAGGCEVLPEAEAQFAAEPRDEWLPEREHRERDQAEEPLDDVQVTRQQPARWGEHVGRLHAAGCGGLLDACGHHAISLSGTSAATGGVASVR